MSSASLESTGFQVPQELLVLRDHKVLSVQQVGLVPLGVQDWTEQQVQQDLWDPLDSGQMELTVLQDTQGRLEMRLT